MAENMIKNKLYRYGSENGVVPAHMNVGKEIYDNMVQNKELTAMINSSTDEIMTYGEFAQMTADIALSLARIGVRKGDVVCICSEKRFEYLPTVLGIMCAGAIFAPTDLTYGSFSLTHRIKIVRPKVMFCSVTTFEANKAIFDKVGCIQHYILYGNSPRNGGILLKKFLTVTTALEDFQPVPVNGWEDIAFIVYSSGTTGMPKGVPVTHLGFLLNAQTIDRAQFRGIATYNSREFYYTYGLFYALSCLRVAATIIYHPNPGEKEMLEAVQKYQIRMMQLAPVTVRELTKSAILDDYDLSSVKFILSSSAYMRKDEVMAIKERLPNLISVLQLYGMSEAGTICNELGAPKGPKPGSSGTPVHGFVVKVVDLETRKPLGPHQQGEICIKGPSVMKGYLHTNNPDCKDEEGFLKTGDVGYYDEDGYFYVVNRIKELIKFNDGSIAPAEFEALLFQHPQVREVGVVGKPHPKHGEVPVAFVALQPGSTVTPEELVQYVDSQVTYTRRLAGGVRIVDSLPKGAGEKLDRQRLKHNLMAENGY